MNIQTCTKYLDYVTSECDKILQDRQVSGDELIHLIRELQLFKDRVRNSELPDEVKTNISGFKLDYSIEGVEQTERRRNIAYIILRGVYMLMERKMMEKRLQAVYGIRDESARLSFFIKGNYTEE